MSVNNEMPLKPHLVQETEMCNHKLVTGISLGNENLHHGAAMKTVGFGSFFKF